MSALKLLAHLRAAGVQLEVDGDRLRVVASKDVLTDELRRAIAANKAELLRYLSPEGGDDAELHPVTREEHTPLSPGQERLWAMVTRAPDSRRYNLPLAFRVRGPFDMSAFRRAVASVIERHEVLRSVILHDETGPWTEIRDLNQLHVVRQESGPPNAGTEWMHQRVETEAGGAFNISEGPLIRLVVVDIGVADHLLMITIHHIVADGWSFEIFFDELASAYRAACTDQHIQLPSLPLQYADVAAWQRKRLTPERRQRAVDFWRGCFAGTPYPLGLQRALSLGADHRVLARLQSDLVNQIEAHGNMEGTTPFVVSLAAYAAYLATVTGSTDVILCTPAVGREREALRGIIGYINNVLPLRLHVDREATFRHMVQSTRSLLLSCLDKQDLPFQDIAAMPETQRIPLTRGMFSYSGRSMRSLRLEDCHVEALTVPGRSTDFDLGLLIEDGEATLALREGVLGAIVPETFLSRYLEFMGAAVAHPDLPIAELQHDLEIPRIQLSDERTRSPRGALQPDASAETTQMVVGLTSDPLELQLALIWERLFGVQPIGPHDNFFDLGGHSLLAVELLETVQREMGAQLTLSTLAEHATVSTLARVLINKGWEPEPGSLIPMQKGGDGPPFVLLHSFEGHLFLYNELAAQLSKHHPVFGCQAVGIDGKAQPLRTVEDMAAYNLSLIDEQIGDGPIVLAAMCFGVSVGLEMARRRSAGGKPSHFMLIDSAWEHLIDTATQSGPRLSVVQRLRLRGTRELTRARYWLRETTRMVTGSPYAQREARIRRRTAKAWLDYTPRPYDGRMTLLRAIPESERTNDWKIGALEKLALGDFATVHVPGDHFTLLRSPHVAALADAMVAAVNRRAAAR